MVDTQFKVWLNTVRTQWKG